MSGQPLILQRFHALAAIVSMMLIMPSYASTSPPVPNEDSNELLRDSGIAVREGVNTRYRGLAASAIAYEAALDNLALIRSRLVRSPDGTLKASTVKELAEAYKAVAAACHETAKKAQQVDKDNWPSTYQEQVAELNTALREDEDANKWSHGESDRLRRISNRSISDNSYLSRYEFNIQQTTKRISIYKKALEVYKRINDLIDKNDDMIHDYETVFTNLEACYADAAKTLHVTFRYQRLLEVEQTVLGIIKQPEQLQPEAQRLVDGWKELDHELDSITGG